MKDILKEINTLSSGTLAVLSKESRYDALDDIRTTWYTAVQDSGMSFDTWVDAWFWFQEQRRIP